MLGEAACSYQAMLTKYILRYKDSGTQYTVVFPLSDQFVSVGPLWSDVLQSVPLFAYSEMKYGRRYRPTKILNGERVAASVL